MTGNIDRIRSIFSHSGYCEIGGMGDARGCNAGALLGPKVKAAHLGYASWILEQLGLGRAHGPGGHRVRCVALPAFERTYAW